MPSNNLIDKVRIPNEEVQIGYDEYDISADASNITVTYGGASTDMQTVVSDIENTPELSPDEVDFNYDDSTAELGLTTPVFKGTLAEWNALTAQEKAHYDNGIVNIEDANEYVSTDIVVDEVIDGDMHAVTSNAAFGLINLLYPVGSIYMSVNNINPGTYLSGTTWEAWGSGRVPVGVNANDTDFETVEQTGGEKTHTLTASEMPVHTHTFTGTAVTSGNQNANHTHTTTTGNPSANHYHNVKGNTGYQSAGHTHSFSTGTTSQNHTHRVANVGTSGSYGLVDSGGASSSGMMSTGGQMADHQHSGTTGGISANHYHGVNINSGNVSAWHTHTGTSGVQSANHQHSVTAAGTNANAGSGNAHNIMNPYITCYMWKRIA